MPVLQWCKIAKTKGSYNNCFSIYMCSNSTADISDALCLCVCLYVAKEVQSCTPDVTDCIAASFCASVFTVKHRRARPTLTVINTQRCRDYRCWISPGLHQRISWHTCNDIRTTVSNKNHWPVGVIVVIFLILYTFLQRDAMHPQY